MRPIKAPYINPRYCFLSDVSLCLQTGIRKQVQGCGAEIAETINSSGLG